MSTMNQTQPMAYEDLMKPDEDWRNLADSAHRRKIQNRLAQRAYRRNLRERNHEVKQLQQKIQELEDAARGTPIANDLATTWDAPPAPTQETDFAAEQIKPDFSLSHQNPISGQPSTVHASPNMDEFDFFASFEDHTQPTSALIVDGSNPPSVPPKKSPNAQSNQPRQTHRSTRSRIGGTPTSVSDLMEISASLSTTSSSSSSMSSCSRHHAHPSPPPHISTPTPVYTAVDTSMSAGSPWNQLDPHSNIPRPSLSLIHLAVAAGNADTLRLLLQDLALPLNRRDHAGYTPLQRAVMSGRTDLVVVLLENGAGSVADEESDDWSLDTDLVAV